VGIRGDARESVRAEHRNFPDGQPMLGDAGWCRCVDGRMRVRRPSVSRRCEDRPDSENVNSTRSNAAVLVGSGTGANDASRAPTPENGVGATLTPQRRRGNPRMLINQISRDEAVTPVTDLGLLEEAVADLANRGARCITAVSAGEAALAERRSPARRVRTGSGSRRARDARSPHPNGKGLAAKRTSLGPRGWFLAPTVIDVVAGRTELGADHRQSLAKAQTNTRATPPKSSKTRIKP